jgi:hypothetical protein
MDAPEPPTDGGGFKDFYHNWTNSILQQLKRNFCKIADASFRISTMTNSFKYSQAVLCEYRPYSLVPDPKIRKFCEASWGGGWRRTSSRRIHFLRSRISSVEKY